MNEDLLKMEEFHERGYSFDTPIRYFHFKSVGMLIEFEFTVSENGDIFAH